MKYSSLENFETARIYIYIYLSVLLGRNFRHLYSPAGNLIVSRRGVCRSVSRGEVEESARFSSGKCRSVSFQFAHCRGSRLFWESSFPWPPRFTSVGPRFRGGEFTRGTRRRLRELSLDRPPPPRQLFVVHITRVHSTWSF